MARSGVVTNRKRLDAFLRAGRKIERLVLRVGQLSGQPKYPKGHVGAKSRGPRGGLPSRRIKGAELRRRAQVRGARRQLEGLDKGTRKATLGVLKAAFKQRGIKAPTLGRRSAARVAVAKVAGVLHAGSQFHVGPLRARESIRLRENRAIVAAMLRGGAGVPRMMQAQGRNAKAAVRRAIKRARHEDTGRLLRNTQFEIIDRSAAPTSKKEYRAAKRRRQTKRRATAKRRRAEAR